MPALHSWILAFPWTLRAAQAAPEDNGFAPSGGWLMAFLWAIGFDGRHTLRGVLILLGLLALTVAAVYLVYRRVRRELTEIGRSGRQALGHARNRWDRFSRDASETLSRTDPELARERSAAATLRDSDPGFDLERFKHHCEQDFVASRRGASRRELRFENVRLLRARRDGTTLFATIRFTGTLASGEESPQSFREEWTFARPTVEGSAWNVVEEKDLRPAA